VKCKLGSFCYPSDWFFLFPHFGGDLERALACGFQGLKIGCYLEKFEGGIQT
jgi:hypothetical protein